MESTIVVKLQHNGAYRRFNVEVPYGQNKLDAVLATARKIVGENVQLVWKDEDGDDVLMTCDEELAAAVDQQQKEGSKVLRVSSIAQKPSETTTQPDAQPPKRLRDPAPHPGVICDGCDAEVVGHRYKCVMCSDFDLCETCERMGKHAEHGLLRIVAPNVTHIPWGTRLRVRFGGSHCQAPASAAAPAQSPAQAPTPASTPENETKKEAEVPLGNEKRLLEHLCNSFTSMGFADAIHPETYRMIEELKKPLSEQNITLNTARTQLTSFVRDATEKAIKALSAFEASNRPSEEKNPAADVETLIDLDEKDNNEKRGGSHNGRREEVRRARELKRLLRDERKRLRRGDDWQARYSWFERPVEKKSHTQPMDDTITKKRSDMEKRMHDYEQALEDSMKVHRANGDFGKKSDAGGRSQDVGFGAHWAHTVPNQYYPGGHYYWRDRISNPWGRTCNASGAQNRDERSPRPNFPTPNAFKRGTEDMRKFHDKIKKQEAARSSLSAWLQKGNPVDKREMMAKLSEMKDPSSHLATALSSIYPTLDEAADNAEASKTDSEESLLATYDFFDELSKEADGQRNHEAPVLLPEQVDVQEAPEQQKQQEAEPKLETESKEQDGEEAVDEPLVEGIYMPTMDDDATVQRIKKTQERLLEMGFGYFNVMTAVDTFGDDLEKCVDMLMGTFRG